MRHPATGSAVLSRSNNHLPVFSSILPVRCKSPFLHESVGCDPSFEDTNTGSRSSPKNRSIKRDSSTVPPASQTRFCTSISDAQSKETYGRTTTLTCPAGAESYEPGKAYMPAGSGCMFHLRVADQPRNSISTPWESRGDLAGQVRRELLLQIDPSGPGFRACYNLRLRPLI